MVLQIKEIPLRPAEYDGALCLFGLVEGCGESVVRASFKSFGTIISYEAGAGSTPTIVRFSTHKAALACKRAVLNEPSRWSSLCAGIDTLYNERSYDGREGDQSREDDKGRGWCAARVRTRAPWVIPESSSAHI